MYKLKLLKRSSKRRKAIIISATGNTMIDSCFPYYFKYEIVPFLWDVWPSYWNQLFENLSLFECKTVFVTVKSFADKLNKDYNIKAYYIPEGIDTSIYFPGSALKERPFDIIEIGRQHKEYHKVIKLLQINGAITVNSSKIDSNGNLQDGNLQFPTHDALCKALPNYKLMVCFPQCDTNPQKAGNMETLTQRYWEAMLSRCIIIGRAPKELIDLIGYNPVIDVDWDNAEGQLIEIVKNASRYQELVDKNRRIAMDLGSWDSRMDQIKENLKKSGYIV